MTAVAAIGVENTEDDEDLLIMRRERLAGPQLSFRWTNTVSLNNNKALLRCLPVLERHRLSLIPWEKA